jgi:hypothetical protein
MGFNIEQYEMYDNDSYSNAGGCGVLHPFNKKKREACEQAKKVSNLATNADTALSKGAVCVKGVPVYVPHLYLLTSKAKRTQNRTICRMRKEDKMKDDVAPAGAVNDNPATDAQAPATDAQAPSTDTTNRNAALSSGVTTPEKSNTGMYIGIGAGVLAIAIVSIILIKRK